jgi:hypothetical protein
MAINPDIDNGASSTRIVKRHRRYTVSASGEVTIKGFEIPTIPSFLLRPDPPEQNQETIPSIPTNIARSGAYQELTFPISRIELCD